MTWCNINMSGSNLCFSLSNVNTPDDLRNCTLNTFLNMLFTFKVTSSDHLATLSFFFNCYNIFKLNSTDVSNLHIKIIFSSVHVFCIRCRRLSTAKWQTYMCILRRAINFHFSWTVRSDLKWTEYSLKSLLCFFICR